MYFQSEKIFSDENIILGLTFQPMLDLVVIAEIAEIDSTIEMTTVIIIETTMVKTVLKVKKVFRETTPIEKIFLKMKMF